MYLTDITDKSKMCTTKSGNKIHWLLTTEIGAPSYELRYIEIPAGGHTSHGHHPHEHEVFIVKGKGQVLGGDTKSNLYPGVAVFIPGNEVHQFFNGSETEPLGIICVVPKGAEAESKPPCK